MPYQRTLQLVCFITSWFFNHQGTVPIRAAETAVVTAPTATSNEGQIVLENSTLRALFNRESGFLVNLISKRTGWEVQRRAELGRSFQMHIPLTDRRNNLVLGNQ